MQEPTVIHHTFVIERAFPKPPERVFAAFAELERKRRWYAEGGGNTVEAFEMDFRVGGIERVQYRMSDATPFPGAVLASEGSILDIVPDKRLVIASAMSLAGRRFSASLVTVELLATAQGTDLIFTHQGAFFEGADGPEMREAGWRQILARLDSELAR